MDPATACRGLRAFQPAPHRMRLEALPRGGLLLDDSYNANAASMAVALDTLRAVSVTGRRIAVLGDMFELGSYGPAAHEQVGRDAAGIDRLLCVGALAARIASGARAAGLQAVDCDSRRHRGTRVNHRGRGRGGRRGFTRSWRTATRSC